MIGALKWPLNCLQFMKRTKVREYNFPAEYCLENIFGATFYTSQPPYCQLNFFYGLILLPHFGDGIQTIHETKHHYISAVWPNTRLKYYTAYQSRFLDFWRHTVSWLVMLWNQAKFEPWQELWAESGGHIISRHTYIFSFETLLYLLLSTSPFLIWWNDKLRAHFTSM